MVSIKFYEAIFKNYLSKLQSSKSKADIVLIYKDAHDWLTWLKSSSHISITQYHKFSDNLDKCIYNSNSSDMQQNNFDFPRYLVKALTIAIISGLSLYLLFLLSSKYFKTEGANKQQPNRILPFRGVLKDREGNPISSKSDMYFTIYDSPFEGNKLYQGGCVGQNAIVPEYNGGFTIALGTDCNMDPIPGSIFNKNSILYVGVSIGNGQEILPRYKISTSGYAQDTALLGGLPLGTVRSSIPFIDENSTITIDEESPKLRSTSGIFAIEGSSIALQTTEGVAANIYLQPGIGSNTIISSGNLGLGDVSPRTKLSIVGIEPHSSIVSFRNLALSDESDMSILDLGLATGDRGSKSKYIQFFSGSTKEQIGKNVGSIRLNNNSVVYETSAADFAEYFYLESNQDIKPGNIVTISSKGIDIGRKGEKIVGVVTDTAGYIGNANNSRQSVLVGLVGQIDLFVSTINGMINIGDEIEASIIEGYGARSLNSKEIVGIALSSMDDISENFIKNKCPAKYKNFLDLTGKPIQCGLIRILLRPK